jgi:hypothetical protein
MGRLALDPLELVRRVRNVGVGHRRRAGTTAAKRVPAAVELRSHALKTPMVLGGQLAMAGIPPQPLLLLDQLLDPIAYGRLVHSAT